MCRIKFFMLKGVYGSEENAFHAVPHPVESSFSAGEGQSMQAIIRETFLDYWQKSTDTGHIRLVIPDYRRSSVKTGIISEEVIFGKLCEHSGPAHTFQQNHIRLAACLE